MKETTEINLSADVWLYLSQFLDVKSIFLLSLACKNFKAIFNLEFARKALLNFSIKQIEQDATVLPENLLFLDSRGTVWRYYYPYPERLVRKDLSPFPKIIPNLPKIKTIVCGDHVSFLLSQAGDVFAFGESQSGALGFHSKFLTIKKKVRLVIPIQAIVSIQTKILDPVQVAGLKNITAIAACGSNSFFLDNEGKVRVCGQNRYGELGLGHNKSQKTVKVIAGLPPIVQMEVKIGLSFFLDDKGSVWVTGTEVSGVGTLGCAGLAESSVAEPKKITSLPVIKKIVSTYLRTFFLTSTNEVYACGLVRSLGFKNKVNYQPKRIKNLIDIEQIFPFAQFTIFLDIHKKPWLCGTARYGIPEDDLKTARLIPRLENIEKVITNAFSGQTRLVFIDSSQTAWAWLNSKTGQSELVKIETLSGQKNVFAERGATLTIDSLGNPTIEKVPPDSPFDSQIIGGLATPFNFMVEHQFKVLESCGLSLSDLSQLACSTASHNEVFYHALINRLKKETRGVRLYFLMQINDSVWKKQADFSFLLLSTKQDWALISRKEDNELLRLACALASFYEKIADDFYATKGYVDSIVIDTQDKICRKFLTLLINIAEGKIKNGEELCAALDNKRRKNALPFFPRKEKHGGESLLKILNKNPQLFSQFKEMVEFYIEAIKSFPSFNFPSTLFEFVLQDFLTPSSLLAPRHPSLLSG